MIRAHLRRFIGGGLDGPLRSLPQFGARAKPALEADHQSLGGKASDRSRMRVFACHVGVFHFRAPALPAQRFPGGGIGRGAKPPSECPRRWRPRPHAQRTGSTPRVRPSGAVLQLDPSHRSSPSVSPDRLLALRRCGWRKGEWTARPSLESLRHHTATPPPGGSLGRNRWPSR